MGLRVPHATNRTDSGSSDAAEGENVAAIDIRELRQNTVVFDGRNMKDSSGQNFYLGVERQFLGNFLLRVNYQGSMGRHLPMLENLNCVDGDGYYNFANSPATIRSSQSPTRPNPLYTGFNYRSNSVSSNYNSLVAEVQKRMSNGLQFQTGYT